MKELHGDLAVTRVRELHRRAMEEGRSLEAMGWQRVEQVLADLEEHDRD